MKFIVISDCHRGSDNKTDNFGKKEEKKLIFLLKEIRKRKINFLYILGDFDELWQGKGLTEKKRLKYIYKRYWKLEKEIEKTRKTVKIQKIFGNHDYLLKKLYKLPEKVVISVDKWNILLMHGHQFDEQYKTKFSAFIGRIGTEFWGIIENIIGSKKANKLLNKIGSKERKMKKMKSATKLPDDSYVKKALKEAKSLKMDVIIIGHTHTQKKVIDKNTIYINSGCRVNGKNDFVYVDTSKKEIKLNSF